MKKASTDRIEPQLTDEPSPFDLSRQALEREGVYRQLDLGGVARGDATQTRWSQVTAQGARLGIVPWTGAHWQDALFTDCDWANAQAPKVDGARIAFVGCRLMGFNAPESRWEDALWRDCNFQLAQFRYGKFVRARFENCDFGDADLQNCDLRGAVFDNCRLGEAHFSFCQLQDADICSSDIEGLQIDSAALKGLVTSPFQAALLGRLLGLNVQWGRGDGQLA
jgi:uncharacterized protein YjbI with pentapeptide repeats